ncbi:DUF6290 family protein [Anaerococcus sp. Marseille-Q7828]|uniref:DUF6290 family protein n=1 Tax=Anaerococcus sp. Marseille-Q7828 TaxID=3036300 RepID=UPI0024AE1211|nr:DUF6290 family protein [Anaerococcus sp. Marseille-Q7828]
MIRKNITLTKEQNNLIEKAAKIKGVSFSEFLRNSAINEIKRQNELDLAEFLKANCKNASDEEQKEFESMGFESYDMGDFEEISLDELL